MSKIDIHWYSENTAAQPLKGAVIFLPGRTNYGYCMLRQYTSALDWSGVALFSTTPRIDQGWYPPPRGSQDQGDAVSGLHDASAMVERIVTRVCKDYGLSRDQIILSGFSMGAVTGVHWATQTKDPVAAVICHSGAILEPWNVPKAKHAMPIVLNHAVDDYCFSWEERYIPMKRALLNRGYNAWFAERESGDHHVHPSDITCCRDLFESTFHSSLDWQPCW